MRKSRNPRRSRKRQGTQMYATYSWPSVHTTVNSGKKQLKARYKFMGRNAKRFVVGMAILAAVVALIVINAVASGATSNAVASGATSAAQKGGSPSSSGYWNMPQQAIYGVRSSVTDKRAFYIGDTIVMPNKLKLQVTKVQRNWQPPAADSAGYGGQYGDNPAGRETILVWFTATNTSKSPVNYNDSMFTLLMAGQPEQRVAQLSVLPRPAYGDRGLTPWLLPGESTSTFVPFLIVPGATPVSFQYHVLPSLQQVQKTSLEKLVLPTLVIHLRARQDGASQTFTFVGNKSILVK